MKVDIEELRSIFKRLEEIDNVDLKDIEFFENGEKLNIPEINFEKFKFMGLINHDFIRFEIYKEDYSQHLTTSEILALDKRIKSCYHDYDGETHYVEIYYNISITNNEIYNIFKSTDKEDILNQIRAFMNDEHVDYKIV